MKKEVAVVAIPRTGSTYLFRCLAGLPPGAGSPKGATLENLPVMKCHSLAPPDHFHDPWREQLFRHCYIGGKVIWVFGDPLYSVFSTMKKRWDKVHAANCGCFRDLKSVDLINEDAFNYEKMFDSWTNPRMEYPVLRVRYETMWKNRFVIEWFLRRKVKWNEWHPRRKTVKEILPDFGYKALTATYSTLMQKIETYPDVTLNGDELRIAGDYIRVADRKE